MPPLTSARREARVLRPHAMLGPHLGPHRRGRFVAVGQRRHAGRRIIAEVAVDVDDPGRDVLAGAVDLERSGGARRVRARRPPGSRRREDDRAIVDPPPVAVEHGGVADDRQHAGIADVGRRIRVLVDRGPAAAAWAAARAPRTRPERNAASERQRGASLFHTVHPLLERPGAAGTARRRRRSRSSRWS